MFGKATMKKRNFDESWLEKRDPNGHVIGDWAVKINAGKVYCRFCEQKLSYTSNGLQQLKQHVKSKLHQQECKAKSGPDLPRSGTSPDSSNDAGASAAKSALEKARNAELEWVLHCIKWCCTLESCDGVEDLFVAMFGDAVPQDFTMSRMKAAYVLNDALAPFFKDEFLDDLGDNYFTVCYGETEVNELQVAIRYWSPRWQRVVTRHLQTFFVQSPTNSVLTKKILSALDAACVPLERLLTLRNGGLNARTKVARFIDEELTEIRGMGLVNDGTCNIHTLHEAFRAGLSKLGENSCELVVAVYNFFNGEPARWEEFVEIQSELNFAMEDFLAFTPPEWLGLEGAATRLIEHWDPVCEYFLTFLPKRRPNLTDRSNYLNVVELLTKPTIMAELAFVCAIARLFRSSMDLLYKEEPTIHVMFDELLTVINALIERVCKPESIMAYGVQSVLMEPNHLLPADSIHISEDLLSEMSEMDETNRFMFLTAARDHMVQICTYMMTKSCLISDSILDKCRCLRPNEVSSARSSVDIGVLASRLPILIDGDSLVNEWILLETENMTESEGRIDEYWAQFFAMKNQSGDQRYPNVSAVVKAVLTLSFGTADIERCWSSISHMFASEQDPLVDEKTLSSAALVKSALNTFQKKEHKVLITRQLLEMAQVAHANYRSHLLEEATMTAARARNEEEVEDEPIDEAEEVLKILKQESDSDEKKANDLFEQAAGILKKATEQNDWAKIAFARKILEGVYVVRKKTSDRKRRLNEMELDLDMKKRRSDAQSDDEISA